MNATQQYQHDMIAIAVANMQQPLRDIEAERMDPEHRSTQVEKQKALERHLEDPEVQQWQHDTIAGLCGIKIKEASVRRYVFNDEGQAVPIDPEKEPPAELNPDYQTPTNE